MDSATLDRICVLRDEQDAQKRSWVALPPEALRLLIRLASIGLGAVAAAESLPRAQADDVVGVIGRCRAALQEVPSDG
jgi:hypothetical protein